MAVSDKPETLKLFISDMYNVTATSISILTNCGKKVIDETSVEAKSISELTKIYPVNMIRMDVEGHEYKILSGNVPDKIRIICMELHIIHPYKKAQAKELLQNLSQQGFKTKVMIEDFPYGFFPIIKRFGLETLYNLINILNKKNHNAPFVKTNVDLKNMLNELPEECVFHLILQR